jgi:hypothetical protein
MVVFENLELFCAAKHTAATSWEERVSSKYFCSSIIDHSF